MQRNIYCSDCEPTKRADFGEAEPYPGEHVRFVSGRARELFLCDSCNRRIPAGERCLALTIWGGRPSVPAWESSFLHLEEGGGEDGR